MTVVIPHHKTRLEAVGEVDKAATALFASVVNGPVQLAEQKKAWQGSVMTFSFVGKMGFVSVPFSGTAAVDDKNITIECELPGIIKNLIGEEKIRAGIEQKVKGLLT